MWSIPVDLYCERRDPAFWAEPVNALTNLAFLLAAAAAFVLWRRSAARDGAVLVLIVVTVLVGLGSFAFHTLATRGASLLDVVPIALFIYGYFWFALHRFVGLAWPRALAATIAFFILSSWFPAQLPRGFLNGSGGYLPAWAAMVGIGAWLTRRRHPAGRPILAAALVFTLSIACRAIDQAVCATTPLGTHFLWHLLNALVLYLLLRAAIVHGAPRVTPIRS